jgi:hypothetical protein
MVTTTNPQFRIHPIPTELLEQVRRSRIDVSGSPVELVTAEGGEPLRCCLRDAEASEQILLFGYEPPLPASPYREIGPVFAHVQPCAEPYDPACYPRDWRSRPQVLRAYDRRGWIHPATRTHDGSDPRKAIAEVLAESEVEQVHSRNIAYGCYMFRATRSQ